MNEVRRFDLSGDCAELVERPNGDYVEYSDYAAALAKIAELEKQMNGMKRCSNCVNKENDQPCYQCKDKSLWKWGVATPTKYRCADRDDGCGRCPRSEEHEHPDQDCGDECYRRGGKVTCERCN